MSPIIKITPLRDRFWACSELVEPESRRMLNIALDG